MLDQAGLADGFTGMYKQIFQQSSFLGGKRYGTAPGTYLPAGGIHCDCAAGQHTPFLYGAPAEQCPYPGEKRGKMERFEDGKSYVFLQNEDGTLRRQPVTTGFSNGKLTEILDGLQQDDVAVVEETYEDR